jgi:predicted alpha/beta hydrolase family esterase
MIRPVLFIQGGAEGAYREDAALAESLRRVLGMGYDVRYPEMPNENDPPYDAWKERILAELETTGPSAILVGHSIGASVIIKLLTEAAPPVAGVFLISTPFWYDDKFWRWPEAELPEDAGRRIAPSLPLFFYHGTEDEVVPFAHLDRYARFFPQATIRPLPGRNHQIQADLSEVGADIRALG